MNYYFKICSEEYDYLLAVLDCFQFFLSFIILINTQKKYYLLAEICNFFSIEISNWLGRHVAVGDYLNFISLLN